MAIPCTWDERPAPSPRPCTGRYGTAMVAAAFPAVPMAVVMSMPTISFTGVRHEVARVFIMDDPVFCHRDPTRTCVGGNPEVRSSWDNVALACKGQQQNRKAMLRLLASKWSGARVGGYG